MTAGGLSNRQPPSQTGSPDQFEKTQAAAPEVFVRHPEPFFYNRTLSCWRPPMIRCESDYSIFSNVAGE